MNEGNGPGEHHPAEATGNSAPAPQQGYQQDNASSSQPPTVDGDRAEWLRLFVAAVARRAARPGVFTTYDVAVEARLSEPMHPNWWGAGMGVCRAEGIVVAVAAVPSARPKTAKSLVRLWVGAQFALQDDAA